MNKNESLREYFRRAKSDAGVRAHLLGNARQARRLFGGLVLVFGALAFGDVAYLGWSRGTWMSGASLFYTFAFAVNWLIYDKFGDRIAALESLDRDPAEQPPPGKGRP